MFTPYLYGQAGWKSLFDQQVSGKSFGRDLKLFLIEFYVDGELAGQLPLERKMGNYTAKTRTISAKIPVRFHQFHLVDERNRREFIVESIMWAVKSARLRLEPRHLDVDFEKLQHHVEETNRQFLASRQE